MIKKICVALLMSCVVGSSTLLIGLVSVFPAYSQDNATINYFNDGLRQARSGWANLNSEQREVDRRIQTTLQSIGKRSIPVTPANVTWMIQQIGVNPDLYTAGFVAGRMDVYAQTTAAMDRTDSLLCSIGTQFNISAGAAYCP
jgi:hypothetical protein